MRFFGRSLVGLFLLALTAGLLAWAGQITYLALQELENREDDGPPSRERVLAANVLTAAPETITPILTTFGEVRARRVLELRAPSAGRLVELAPGFEDGGTVTAGQTLLRIDPSEAEADLAVARAELAGAEAELRDAERALTLAQSELAGAEAQRDLQSAALRRQQDLSQRGVGSTAAVEAAELALSAAEQTILTRRGAIAQAQTRIDSAGLAIERAAITRDNADRDLSDRTVVAGFDGQLSDVSVLLGGLVSANEQVATLVDPTDLEVVFNLSTAQHARLLDDRGRLIGAPIRAVLDVQGLTLATDGTVIRESATVGDTQTGRRVFATLESAEGFRPGDFLRVEVEEPAIARAIRLPATALSPQSTVLALGDEDRLEEIEVDLLRRQGDDVLVAGRIGGRDIVAERTPALGIGIKVRPLRPGAAPEAPALVTLDPERRARLKAFVQANTRIPDARKARLLAQLEDEEVPAEMVEQLESRMGG
ncbi:efflux RND transporter periplasmic adaptor subunit [Jannaschia donghaensis]|uniref:Multidrug resistance protein MdtN n=1 Tax=Jannaschia donghaensis TaxID=420998 RepID=A0A0M6YJT6_9RHOB|nr:HlyD family efflux transporter periplasmic adaptor subunit [Jannaschia donghaensis]CTQ49773.1 Multidrug resistance protein MdtN [Jannaschia donghaensis]